MPMLRSLLALTALAIALPTQAQVRLQVIHNAADPAASEVDVYVNGALTLDDFAFRTATPFLDLPANTDLSVAVAPGTSTGVGDAVFTQVFNLPDGAYQLVANGVLDPGSFAANPDGRSIGFALLAATGAQEASADPTRTAIRVVHGATDAPTVDVRSPDGVLVDDAAYSDITGYLSVIPHVYTLAITLADGTPVAGFRADLEAAGGAALTVLASGFLDPSANQSGAAFGLLAVFADGTTALLPSAPLTSRLQVIHNAADPAAAEVDVYVNGALTLDDFAFRAATPFIDVPAYVPLEVAVAPSTSSSAADAVFTRSYTLAAGTATQLVANGVLDPGSFAANPDGRATAFTLFAARAREASEFAGRAAVRVVHGATDAPTVDVRSGHSVLVDDAAYSDVTAYRIVGARPYTLGITLADGTPVAAFAADLSGAGGEALTVLASGFLAPASNQNGAAFGLLAVFADGTTALLPPAAGAARLQVIHNAADPAASEVDVYIDGALALDDFAFRTATPYLELPAYVPLEIAIAPASSSSAGDAVTKQTLVLPDGRSQLVANGVLVPSAFEANPDGRPIEFALLSGAGAMEASGDGRVAVRVMHGATDAPTVDVRSGGAVLVDDAAYTDMSPYLMLAPDDYTLDITTADGTPVAAFGADLSGAAGAAVTVIASGFLDPADDQNGAAFGLVAVFADGTTALLGARAVAEEGGPDASALELGAPSPNPARGDAEVSFSLAAAGAARVAVYDALGRRVAVVADGEHAAGAHRVRLGLGGLAPGAYLVRLDSAAGSRTRTLTIAR